MVDVFSVVHFVIHKLLEIIIGMMIWHHLTLPRCMEAKILLLITKILC